MKRVNSDECAAAGLDEKEVQRIANGLSKYAKQAGKLGMEVFGGASGGTLRFNDGQGGDLVLGDLEGSFAGGVGDAIEDHEGLLRGEHN